MDIAKTSPPCDGFSKDRFEAVARMEREHFWFVARRALTSFLIGQSRPAKADTLVDLGCGPGHALSAWLEHSSRVIGVDLHGTAPQTQKGSIETVRANASKTGIESGSADVILALDLLEHTDDRAVLAECSRILKPGGRLVVSVPAHQWLWGPRDEAAGHLRRYSSRQLRARLTKAGFKVVHTVNYQFFLFPLVIISRWLSPRSATVRDIEDTPPALINRVLSGINRGEVALTRLGVRFPFGSSIFMVAQNR